MWVVGLVLLFMHVMRQCVTAAVVCITLASQVLGLGCCMVYA